VSRRSQAARARHPSDDDDEEDGYTNPVAPPPQVGLTLGGKSTVTLGGKSTVTLGGTSTVSLGGTSTLTLGGTSTLPTFSFHSKLPPLNVSSRDLVCVFVQCISCLWTLQGLYVHVHVVGL